MSHFTQKIHHQHSLLFRNKNVFLFCATVAISIGVSNYVIKNKNDPPCHSTVPIPFKFMGTKTPYFPPGHPFRGKFDGQVDHSGNFIPQECEPLQIWMIVRHGTRNPAEGVIAHMKTILPNLRDQIIKSHNDGKGHLCLSELDKLKNWAVNEKLHESEEKWLVKQGISELKGIAQRYKERFPSLFPPQFHNDTYKFKYTKTQRAEASAKTFTSSIFGPDEIDRVWFPQALASDPILRFYKGCPKWIKEVDKNPATFTERKLFESSPTFSNFVSRISTRLGFTDLIPLPKIELMALNCAFESAWNPSTPSPWCGLFSEEDFSIWELRQDIEYYWVDGYGFPITYTHACPPILDFMTNFEEKGLSGKGPNVIAYFTHSGTTLKLLARLGLFNDSFPLTASSYGKERKWITGKIDTFASNLAFVLLKCGGELKVTAMFQEEPIKLPACNNEHICSLQTLKTNFLNEIDSCDVKEMCKMDS